MTDRAVTTGFLEDPDAVIVSVVTDIEPDLAPADLHSAIVKAAPSRVQRRRLAHALHQHPDLLTSGRPEGPPQVERLIRALRATGACRLALPRCGRCDQPKPLPQLDGKIRIYRAEQRSGRRGSRGPEHETGSPQPSTATR